MSSSSVPSTSTNTSFDSECHQIQEDNVTPTAEKIAPIYAWSSQLWQGLATKAGSKSFVRDTVNLASMSEGLPAIPDNMQGMTEFCGLATWKLKSTGCTMSHRSRSEGKRRWKPTRRRPTLCSISNSSSFDHSDSESNGIACLFFGWAYILCMTLLEKQRIPVFYSSTSSQTWGTEDELEHGLTVELGNASDEEYRWWVSLLTPGQGWRSPIPDQPIWSVAYTGNMNFRVVRAERAPASSHCNPPSSKQAVEFLSRFASRYNLESQSALALAMALTLPIHNDTSSMVQLPKPRLITSQFMPHTHFGIKKDYCRLDRYMALSSNPLFLSSALWSVFWEPGVECNLVSPWCDPIVATIKPLIDRGDLETLGHVLALRRPSIAPLWYGVTACGNTRSISAIIPFLQTLFSCLPSRPIPEVAAWTGCPQSFMDLSGEGPYVQMGNQVSRADVWRLRHELWDVEPEGAPFRNTPICPWPPFGYIGDEELEIPVRTHINCPRHYWVYAGWTWLFDDGTEKRIEPADELKSWDLLESDSQLIFSEGITPPVYYLNHKASKNAVGDIFRWSATEIEMSGKSIFGHRWVDALHDLGMDDDDEHDSCSDDVRCQSDVSLQRVEDWIMT
ncbi:hypothetical protein MAC_05333 [Metarhizium acridum CQMa 102]|uniref:Immunoglobulin variable region used by the ITC63B heavy chain n=1 Tax=Metarhizium acridum (strain CQMa 102) TaxID=655827 RepID=E9E635_METAQ|nr:uncharacterized protein MAC_05333 [Metarhizium acridum CQMa 102]EFY88568.1 hypothetical protein MAC_05333 [Metarhizium acridum CQMa 102]